MDDDRYFVRCSIEGSDLKDRPACFWAMECNPLDNTGELLEIGCIEHLGLLRVHVYSVAWEELNGRVAYADHFALK